MDPLSLFDRLTDQLRRYQFRVPESVFWLAALASAAAIAFSLRASATALGLCAGAILGAAAIGIVRWRSHCRRARGGLVVCLFAAPGEDARADEVQRLIVTSLLDKLSAEEARLVHKLPAVVGSDERDFAIRLRRRLRATFLLHGRVASNSGGGYSVYARIAQPIDPGVIHADRVTRDVTFEKASWRGLITRLTSATDVIDEEYPLEFAGELEAVVRGTGGQLAEDQGDYARAERLLRDALAVAPASTSHQIDLLRVALARAIFKQGREAEAIRTLRRRSKDAAAAPELHRTLHRLLFLQDASKQSDRSRREQVHALRAAAEQRADPQLALSLYNLAVMASDTREEAALLDQLLDSNTHYRDAWYVRRDRGAAYWHEAEELLQRRSLDEARPIYAKSAKMYAQAIRRRPHIKFVVTRRSFDFFLWRTPPLLYANAADAHRYAHQRLRASWYAFGERRRRDRWFKRADLALKRGKWAKAAEYFEHVAMVRPDMQRTAARTWEAAALKQLGKSAEAEQMWRETLAEDPGALRWRALLVRDESYGLEPRHLPGNEPTAPDEVNALTEKLMREHDGP